MTFVDRIEKSASERVALVRLTPARDVTSQLTLDSGSVYETSFSYPVARIERNGTALTKVDTLDGNDQWTYDESTHELKLQLASAPDADTNVIILYYYIFLGSAPVAWHEDPEDDETPLRMWEPRIDRVPTFRQSVKNVISGVFTIEASNLVILNLDHDFEKYLSANDSFFQKEVDVWFYIDDPTYIRKIYSGRMMRVDYGETVTIALRDEFLKLDQSAYMGDAEGECVFRRESGSFPSMDPNKSGTPCRYITGRSSRHKNRSLTATAGLAWPLMELDPNETEEAVCTQSGAVSSTANRVWGLCRMSGSIPNNSFTSITRAGVIELIGMALLYIEGPNANYKIGDTFSWTESGETFSGVVCANTSFMVESGEYNIAVLNPVSHTDGAAATMSDLSTSSTSVATPSIGILFDYGGDPTLGPLGLRYGVDYMIGSSATSGGNKFYYITLADNFESNEFGSWDVPLISPGAHRIIYRISNDSPEKHGALLKRICEFAGLRTNDASFTAADSALNVETYFSIPQFDEIEYGSYLEYAQLIAESALGYLLVNESREVEYKLITDPSGDSNRDLKIYGLGELDSSINYDDVITQLVAYNPHNSSDEAINDAEGPSQTVESAAVSYLHGVQKTSRFRHVLQSIYSRIDAIFAVRSKPIKSHVWRTATKDLATDIGDDIEIQTEDILANVRVTSVDKSIDDTKVEAIEIEGTS